MHKYKSIFLLPLLLLFVATSASAYTTKLNDPIAVLGDDVSTFLISADNQYAVYTGDQEREDVKELFSVPTAGGTPVKLNPEINDDSNYPLHHFSISPDSSLVIFIASIVGEPENQLYSVPINGGAVTRLSSGANPVHSGFTFTSDSQYVIYRQGLTFGGDDQLNRVDLTTGDELLLAELTTAATYFASFSISAADDFVVFRTNINGGSVGSVSINGGTSYAPGGNVSQISEYALSADNRVVFRGRASGDQFYSLFSNNLTGTDLITLNDTLVTYGSVHSFVVSPTDSHVAYVADQDTYGTYELFSTTTMGAPSVKLQADIDEISRRTSYSPVFTPDGSLIHYVYGPHLYVIAPGGGTSTTLSPTLAYTSATVGKRYVTPDGTAIAFTMNVEAQQVGIYVSNLSGGSITTLLATPINTYSGAGLVSLAFTSGDNLLFLADYETDAKELFQVPLTGGAVSKISAPSQAGYGVGNNFVISSDSDTVYYQASQEHPNFIGLYKSTLNNRTPTIERLDKPLAEMTDVLAYQVAANEAYVVYRGAMEALDIIELYSVPMTGGGATKLSGTMTADREVERDFAISPTSTHVVFKSDQRLDDVYELYSVPITGGTPTKLNPNIGGGKDVSSFVITPDGAHVLYIADQASNNVHELFKVPIAGGTAERVNHTLAAGESLDELTDILISPDENYVIYRVQPASGTMVLYIAPLDGGTPVPVSNGLSISYSQTILFSADSNYLFFFGSIPDTTGLYVFQAPVTGGTTVARNPIGTNIGEYGLTATQVIYRYRNTNQLVSVPIAGGSEQPLAGTTGDVEHFKADINSERVIFYEKALSARITGQLVTILSDGSDRQDLFSIDDNNFRSYDYTIAGDYVLASLNNATLYSAALDGMSTQLLVDGSSGASVLSYRPSQDNTYIGMSARIDSADKLESYIIPINGGTPEKVSQSPAVDSSISHEPYVCITGACAVIFGAQDKKDVVELYAWTALAPTSVALASHATTSSNTVAIALLAIILSLITLLSRKSVALLNEKA